MPSGNFFIDGRGKISEKRKPAAACRVSVFYFLNKKTIKKKYNPPLKNREKNCDPPTDKMEKL